MLPKILIGIAVLATLFFLIGFFIHGKDELLKGTPLENISQSQDTGSCSNPLVLKTPVDLEKVTAILYPGQERGGHFKWHGGFRFDNSSFDQIEIRAPLDAKITDGSRYIEQGKVQYMFDFQTDCGLRYRFDHLVTLSPKLLEIAEDLPEPKIDDSRTSRINEEVRVMAGEILATAVGYKDNVFVNFGVYDIRGKVFSNPKENAICWFDLLSASDSARVKSLPPGDSKSGTQSTLCKI